MSLHPGLQLVHPLAHLRHRRLIALGQLLDAPRELLTHTIHLALDSRLDGGEQFLVHDQRLDLLLGQLRIVRVGLGIERGLGILQALLERGLIQVQRDPPVEHGCLVLGLGIASDLLETHGDTGLVDPVQLGEGAFVAAVLLLQLREPGGDRLQCGGEPIERGLLRGEITGDDERLGDQIAGPALVAGLALLVGLDDAGRLGGPPVRGDQVTVVL